VADLAGTFLGLALFRPEFTPLLAPDDRATARELVALRLRGVMAPAPLAGTDSG
jgi:hypothetical protein